MRNSSLKLCSVSLLLLVVGLESGLKDCEDALYNLFENTELRVTWSGLQRYDPILSYFNFIPDKNLIDILYSLKQEKPVRMPNTNQKNNEAIILPTVEIYEEGLKFSIKHPKTEMIGTGRIMCYGIDCQISMATLQNNIIEKTKELNCIKTKTPQHFMSASIHDYGINVTLPHGKVQLFRAYSVLGKYAQTRQPIGGVLDGPSVILYRESQPPVRISLPKNIGHVDLEYVQAAGNVLNRYDGKIRFEFIPKDSDAAKKTTRETRDAAVRGEGRRRSKEDTVERKSLPKRDEGDESRRRSVLLLAQKKEDEEKAKGGAAVKRTSLTKREEFELSRLSKVKAEGDAAVKRASLTDEEDESRRLKEEAEIDAAVKRASLTDEEGESRRRSKKETEEKTKGGAAARKGLKRKLPFEPAEEYEGPMIERRISIHELPSAGEKGEEIGVEGPLSLQRRASIPFAAVEEKRRAQGIARQPAIGSIPFSLEAVKLLQLKDIKECMSIRSQQSAWGIGCCTREVANLFERAQQTANFIKVYSESEGSVYYFIPDLNLIKILYSLNGNPETNRRTSQAVILPKVEIRQEPLGYYTIEFTVKHPQTGDIGKGKIICKGPECEISEHILKQSADSKTGEFICIKEDRLRQHFMSASIRNYGIQVTVPGGAQETIAIRADNILKRLVQSVPTKQEKWKAAKANLEERRITFYNENYIPVVSIPLNEKLNPVIREYIQSSVDLLNTYAVSLSFSHIPVDRFPVDQFKGTPSLRRELSKKGSEVILKVKPVPLAKPEVKAPSTLTSQPKQLIADDRGIKEASPTRRESLERGSKVTVVTKSTGVVEPVAKADPTIDELKVEPSREEPKIRFEVKPVAEDESALKAPSTPKYQSKQLIDDDRGMEEASPLESTKKGTKVTGVVELVAKAKPADESKLEPPKEEPKITSEVEPGNIFQRYFWKAKKWIAEKREERRKKKEERRKKEEREKREEERKKREKKGKKK